MGFHRSRILETTDRTQWLVILLDERPSLALTTRDLEDGFTVGYRRYEDTGEGNLTACYDRLIDRARRFVGVRVWPVGDLARTLLDWLPTRSYLRVDADGHFVDIFFAGIATDGESSADQAFGGQVFRTFTGDMALSIDIDYLAESDKDIADLRAADVSWFEPE